MICTSISQERFAPDASKHPPPDHLGEIAMLDGHQVPSQAQITRCTQIRNDRTHMRRGTMQDCRCCRAHQRGQAALAWNYGPGREGAGKSEAADAAVLAELDWSCSGARDPGDGPTPSEARARTAGLTQKCNSCHFDGRVKCELPARTLFSEIGFEVPQAQIL